MAVVNKFNVNREQVTLDADIIENMSANDVSYNVSTKYNENTVGDKISELEKEVIVSQQQINNIGDDISSLKDYCYLSRSESYDYTTSDRWSRLGNLYLLHAGVMYEFDITFSIEGYKYIVIHDENGNRLREIFTSKTQTKFYYRPNIEQTIYLSYWSISGNTHINATVSVENPNNNSLIGIKNYITVVDGVLDGGGNKIQSVKGVCTEISIHLDKGYVYVFSAVDDLAMIVYNPSYMGKTTNLLKHGISIIGEDNFIRLCYVRIDGDDLSVETLTESMLNSMCYYRIKCSDDEFNIHIAASDSSETDKFNANVVLDGVNDTPVLSALFGCMTSIKCYLYTGNYIIDRFYTTNSGQYSAIASYERFDELHDRKPRDIHFIGSASKSFPSYKNVCFEMTSNLYVSIPNDTQDEYSIILCPRLGAIDGVQTPTNTYINLENITIRSKGYTKNITYFDLTFSEEVDVNGCSVSGNAADYYGEPFEVEPANCVGMRVGHGSNNGIHQSVKHCWFHHCRIGLSCLGEHFIIEDVLSHHCWIGFAFGDKNIGDLVNKRGVSHPNTMIGCSIEHCQRYMYLSTYGRTDVQPVSSAGRTIVCIALSAESNFTTPKNTWTDPNVPETSPTKGVEEILQGYYRGRIEGDKIFAAEGSCKNIVFTTY